ncbi:unnamed protein product [Umbelopsis sp. WA50703]
MSEPATELKVDVGTTAPATEQPKKKKDKKKPRKRSSKKALPKTKVVVRRLPPNIPEEIFFNSVKAWVNESTTGWQLFVPGKLSSSKAKQHVFSRAYFHFLTMEAVMAFHQGYDGHLFMDGKGNEYRAVVEFAPFQKIPKDHKTPDPRQGTIETDPEYIAFVESLSVPEPPLNSTTDTKDGLSNVERIENRLSLMTAQNQLAEQANKPKTTPLLEHLRAQKAAQAAAKAKSQAAKAAAKQAKLQGAKGEGTKKTLDEPSKKAQRREKERRKREEKKAAAAAGSSNAQNTSSDAKAAGEKPAKKEPKTKIKQEGVQQIVKILGRQTDKDANTASSSKDAVRDASATQIPATAKASKPADGNNTVGEGAPALTRKEKEKLRQQRREQERQRREKENDGGRVDQGSKEQPPSGSQSNRGGGRGGRGGGRGYLSNRGGRGGGRGI